MVYSTLNSTLYEVGKPAKKEIFSTLKTNQDDINTRVQALEAGASNIIVFNKMIDIEKFARVGTIAFSLLGLTDYQARYGTDWVKIDGSSISGTDLAALYGATLPDFRERFPRIEGGTRTIGAIESDAMKQHNHDVEMITSSTAGTNSFYSVTKPALSENQRSNETPIWTTWGSGFQAAVDFPSVRAKYHTDSISEETRPKSGVMGAYVKTQDHDFNKTEIYKAPISFNLISATITNLEVGSAGTLEIDVKRGTSLSSLASVFSVKPSLSYTAGNYATSSNAVFDTTTVNVNDFLVLDIESLQTNQRRFYVSVFGELS